MEDAPLAFGNGPEAPPVQLERRPELHAVARKVISVLEPLEPGARLRVLRAAAILLELDDGGTLGSWMR